MPAAANPPPPKVPASYTVRKGYFAAGPPFMASRDHMVAGSFNMTLDPQYQSVKRRRGYALGAATNLTFNAATNTPGTDLVDPGGGSELDLRGWGRFAQSRAASPYDIVAPIPIWRILISDDAYTETVGVPEVVGCGALHIGPNASVPFDVLASNLTDGLRSAAGGTSSEYMTPTYGVWAMPFCGWGRQITNDQHHRQANGGRSTIEIGRWIALAKRSSARVPDGVPLRWNLEFNCGAGLYPIGTSDPGSVTQILPVGHIPPVQPVTVTPQAPAVAGSWAIGSFYYTVLYEWEDGSITPAVQWRPPAAGSILGATGWCYFTLAASVQYVDVTFPCGPRGVKARWLLRSPVAATPDPYLIQLTHVVENNTETTYRDYFGGTEALEDISDVYRQDPMWMPECRYLWAFDQRIACAHTRPNRGAILIAPQFYDDPPPGTAWANRTYTRDCLTIAEGGPCEFRLFTRVTASSIEFYLWDDDCTAYGGATPTAMFTRDTLTTTGLTLQDVVDHINARSAAGMWGGGGAPWASAQLHNRTQAWTVAGPIPACKVYAQLAPGADPGAPATELATYGDVPALTTPSTAVTFGDKFRIDLGGGYQEYNLQRAYGNQLPGLMVMNEVWAQRWRPGTKSVFFTGGGPGAAPNALNNWYATNERSIVDEAGDIMGGAPLVDGCLVFSTKGVSILRNIRDGKTGVDEDYRLELLPGFPGCIAPDSIVSRNGAVVWLSAQGLMASDGNGILNLSRFIYNRLFSAPASSTAYWNYAIDQAEASIVDGGDDAKFGCSFIGKRLWVWYPYYAADLYISMVLDLSASPADSGLEQFLDGEGELLGWSSPLYLYGLSSHGTFHDGTTLHHYGLYAGENRSRVGEFELTNTDTSTIGATSPVVGTAYMRLDLFDTDQKKSPSEYVVRYRDDSGARVYLELAIDWTWAATKESVELPLTSAGVPGDQLTRDFALASRGPADVIWLRFRDTGVNAGSTKVDPAVFWGVDIAVSLLAARL